jgi:hypothetical protein
VSASSSSTTLVPNANVVIGGSGANRTVTVTPAANQSGTTTITVTVSDGTATASDTFTVTVNAVNDPPTISDIANQSIQAGGSSGAIAFQVGDPDGGTDGLRLTATTSNPERVPVSAIVFGGSGNNRTVTVTPVGTGAGTADITVTVSDGSLSASDTFVITIVAVVEAPKIVASPENATVDEGGLVTFRVTATGTAPFRYQWLRDGRELGDGLEQTYVIRSVEASQAGGYSVRVSNAAGSVTSAVGTLTVLRLDFGDTPDGTQFPLAYPTLLARDGARHVIVPGFHLGAAVDPETDARVSSDASGDDKGGAVPDDEDGVEWLTQPLVPGQSAQVRVMLPSTAGNGGRLDAFIDFNRDGVWAVPGERVLSGVVVTPGANTLTFAVPADLKAVETFARFRLSREGGLGPTGRAPDGEVEDHPVRVADPPPPESYDFGDAPESSLAVLYRTRLANNGPRHRIVQGFHLGRTVDAENDGQPNADATGDDANPAGQDDEDGVQFATPFEPGKPATLLVTSSADGVLDAWFDVNRANGFEASERLINRFSLLPGVNSIVVNVPAGAVPGETFARFRLSREGVDTPDHPSRTAPVPDGEVEDYRFTIVAREEALDFGDAPEAAAGTVAFGYPTFLARNGARHVIVQGFHLGKTVDAEKDGQPDAAAAGDDLNPASLDDEDGVEFLGPIVAGGTAWLRVTASQDGRLDAWVDFNGNRSWGDAGEQVFVSVDLFAGVNDLSFPVPPQARPGMTFARFRLSKDGKLGFVGQARDGEVEDYVLRIQPGSPCDGNYKGTDFWLTFPGNYPEGPDTPLRLTLCIVGPQGVTGTVSIPGLRFSTGFTLPAGMAVQVVLPDAASLGEVVDVVQNKGIHVEASEPVAVYGMNRIPYSSDGFLGLPVGVVGREYIVAGYPNVFSEASALNGTQFAIVATDDDTLVTIIPSRDVLGHPKGEPYVVPLKQGQTYQLRHPEDATADLTGTEIVSDKPVAVFAGHQCANIDSPSKMFCDHLVEQLLPVPAWSRNFHAVPLATRSNGDVLRIVGSKPNTSIFLNGVAAGTVDRGAVRTFSLTAATRIDASQPVFVAQFARSSDHDGVEDADPFMVTVPPMRFYTRDHMICTGPSAFSTHWVNLVVPGAAAGSITLDGQAVPAAAFTPIGATGFSSARIQVTPGAHALSGAQPFGVIVYGFGPYEGYGWPGGMYFGDIEPPTIVCPEDFTIPTGGVGGTTGASQCLALVPDLRPQIVVADNCELPTQRTLTQVPQPGTAVGPGKYVITVVAHDASGNTSECQVTMTVVDASAASLICPNDMTVQCNKGAGATVAYQVIARTICGSILPVECDPPPGSLFLPGTTTVTCRIPGSPNQVCTFKITVVCPDLKDDGVLVRRQLTLSWEDDAMLETALSPDGPWTSVPAARPPFQPAATGDRQFFRLRSSTAGIGLHQSDRAPVLKVH